MLLNLSSGYTFWIWKRRLYQAPSPQFIKKAVLLRNALFNATWVETGTYLGETTKFLSENGKFVYSIEPESNLCARATLKFKKYSNIKIIKGLSEDVFPQLLPTLSGSVNFWLDGHYSAGITFKGPQDTPILDELKIITNNISKYDFICVMIDDVRCFNPNQAEYRTYPPLNALVDWAENNNLIWNIEHDIFVAKTKVK